MNKKLLTVALILVASQHNETSEAKRRKSPYQNLRIQIPTPTIMGNTTTPRNTHGNPQQTRIHSCLATVEAGISFFVLCSYSCAQALYCKVMTDDDDIHV